MNDLLWFFQYFIDNFGVVYIFSCLVIIIDSFLCVVILDFYTFIVCCFID